MLLTVLKALRNERCLFRDCSKQHISKLLKFVSNTKYSLLLDTFADATPECNITNGSASRLSTSLYSVTCNPGYQMNVTADFFTCQDAVLYPEVDNNLAGSPVKCIPSIPVIPVIPGTFTYVDKSILTTQTIHKRPIYS